MKYKRVHALLLSSLIAANMVTPAMAASTSVNLIVEGQQDESILNVSVPTEIDLHMDKNGVVKVSSTNLKVRNNEADKKVKVDSINVEGLDGWQVKDYDSDISNKTTNTKELGMKINGDKTSDGGNVSLTEGNWTIAESGEKALNVEVKMPKQEVSNLTESNIARIDWEFSGVDGGSSGGGETADESVISNDWGKDRVLKGSITPVTINYDSTSPDTYIESVESDNENVKVSKAPSMYSLGNEGSEVWNVEAVEDCKAKITARLNTGEITEFDVNVYSMAVGDNSGGTGTGDGSEDNPIDSDDVVVNGGGDKQPGDEINTGDITIDIPITTPDGEDTITVTPEIPEDTVLEEGDNNITVEVTVDGVTIYINITININVNQGAETFTVNYVTDGNGTVSEGNRTFTDGSNITFPTVEPNEGYKFNRWVDTSSGSVVTESNTVTGDMTVRAEFIEDEEEENPSNGLIMTVTEAQAAGFTFSSYEDGLQIDSFENKLFSANINVPEQIGDFKVLKINDGVFSGQTNLKSITLPDTVTTVGNNSFKGCTNLEKLVANGVEILGNSALQNCSKLSDISLNFITSIGDNAFNGCTSFSSFTIPETVTNIGNKAFNNFGTENLRLVINCNIPNAAMNSGGVFYNCNSLTNVIIGDSVTSIGNYTFYSCTSLTNVTIGDSVTSIGNDTFNGCTSLTNVTIGDSVTSIGNDTFNGCTSLNNINIPDSVNSIGYSAFKGCASLTSVNIPNSVKSIGDNAFNNCTLLDTVNINCNIPDKDDITYIFKGSNIVNVVIGDGVTYIGNNAFKNCNTLENIKIPDSVTLIGNYSFDGCSSLESIKLPSSVKSIGSFAFYGCTSLKSITIPDLVTVIDNSTFNGCTSLINVVLPNSIKSINNAAFNDCTSLIYINIPDSVTDIFSVAFFDCTSLSDLKVPSNVTTIGNNAFKNVPHITYNGQATGSPWGALSIN